MKPELLKILERVRLSRAVTGAGSGPVTPKPAPCLAVTGVTAVTAENRQGENLHRRHLDATQRAVVADRLATLRHGGDRKSDQGANLRLDTEAAPIMTQEAAAEATGSSRRTVQTAREEDSRQEVEQARLVSIESDSFPVGTLPPVATLRAAALTRPSTFPAVTPVTAVTPHISAVSSVTAADPGAVTGRDKPEPAPRFRAWRARFADGRTMTVLHPAGMDRAEALAAVDRWPGCTVEPLPASRC